LSLVCVDEPVAAEIPEAPASVPKVENEAPWDEMAREQQETANVVAQQEQAIEPPVVENKPALFSKKAEKTKQQLIIEEIQCMIKDSTTLDDLKLVASNIQQLNIELSESEMSIISDDYDAKWKIIKGG